MVHTVEKKSVISGELNSLLIRREVCRNGLLSEFFSHIFAKVPFVLSIANMLLHSSEQVSEHFRNM